MREPVLVAAAASVKPLGSPMSKERRSGSPEYGGGRRDPRGIDVRRRDSDGSDRVTELQLTMLGLGGDDRWIIHGRDRNGDGGEGAVGRTVVGFERKAVAAV